MHTHTPGTTDHFPAHAIDSYNLHRKFRSICVLLSDIYYGVYVFFLTYRDMNTIERVMELETNLCLAANYFSTNLYFGIISGQTDDECLLLMTKSVTGIHDDNIWVKASLLFG